MMIRPLLLCLALASCSAPPKVVWPAGPVGTPPALLPLDQIVVPTAPSLDARGAALAAQAAELRARAAAIHGS